MPKQRTKARRISWDTAGVRGGTLTVKLDGRGSKQWTEHLESVLRRLGAHGGGSRDVEVSGREITVDGVTPGAVEEIHHFLESAVHQVNTDLCPEADEAEDESEDAEPAGPDQEMTEAFRAFASSD